ncbi:MarR family winged helix-turn-helix transcriptional regulator [Janibacter sp. GS2]|uniref:MarR family winged helix-turn-helix transcriptional regulator n=1 Tax=Janibacter sp. GS2 TaxID=3442646 RepID=UPI003EBD4659
MAASRVNHRVEAALSSEEFSAEQWRVLDYLDENGPCTMSVLAQETGTSGATLTRIIDRLVSRALVYRSADGNDRRRVLVLLSDRGRETADRVRPLVHGATDQGAARLTSDERDELTRLLRRMVAEPADDSSLVSDRADGDG